jgi:hypothetical protein
MAFIRSEEYFARKIQNIDNAISGTRAAMENLEHDFQIEAHRSYLASLESSKVKVRSEYMNWRNKQQNIERGAHYKGY